MGSLFRAGLGTPLYEVDEETRKFEPVQKSLLYILHPFLKNKKEESPAPRQNHRGCREDLYVYIPLSKRRVPQATVGGTSKIQ
jgi:hypothetical protein